jgi:hypothetical protein
MLTYDDEQKLLAEANRAGPPTLAPTAATLEPAVESMARPASFGAEALDIVRRHPLPMLFLATGLAYLLLRRKG